MWSTPTLSNLISAWFYIFAPKHTLSLFCHKKCAFHFLSPTKKCLEEITSIVSLLIETYLWKLKWLLKNFKILFSVSGCHKRIPGSLLWYSGGVGAIQQSRSTLRFFRQVYIDHLEERIYNHSETHKSSWSFQVGKTKVNFQTLSTGHSYF